MHPAIAPICEAQAPAALTTIFVDMIPRSVSTASTFPLDWRMPLTAVLVWIFTLYLSWAASPYPLNDEIGIDVNPVVREHRPADITLELGFDPAGLLGPKEV